MKSGFLCLNDSRSNIKSYIKLPLFFEDMLLGTIQLLSNRDNVYIDDSLEADIAGQISLYIEKERIHRQEKKLQQELIASAKQAGMTQVANSVLHNVGNVLNSLNISASLLGENLSKSEMNSLPKLSRMLQENAKNLESYLSHDPKGKLIPAFIVELSKKWEDEIKNYKKEAKIILDSIYTIKNLIKTQLSPEENTSTLEKVQIRTLLDEIIAMKEDEFKIHRIQIIKDCPFTIECLTDKNRLSQVIVNILNNAIEATENLSEREINIKMENTGASLLIHFTDNGVGLDLNQLEKLFSYGFTTKKSGHGFGLYTSLMQLKEIGGDLKATSSGKSRGATFTICLPLLKPSLV
ncbi:MAG: sensor histidine kinase [Parachlamydiaceae bacterium]